MAEKLVKTANMGSCWCGDCWCAVRDDGMIQYRGRYEWQQSGWVKPVWGVWFTLPDKGDICHDISTGEHRMYSSNICKDDYDKALASLKA